MSFAKTFKSNKVYEAAKKFASCSCPANETNNNALFSDIAGFAVSVFLCLVTGIICLSGIIENIILSLIALISILLGCNCTRNSQSAYQVCVSNNGNLSGFAFSGEAAYYVIEIGKCEEFKNEDN